MKIDRIFLREIVSDDLQNVFLGLSHPDVIEHYGVHFETLQATKEQMIWFKNLKDQNKGIWWAICDTTTRKFLGAGGLNDLSQEHKKAEVGLWLLKEYWGQGIMGEAMPLILNYAFDVLQLHRIEGFVDSENMKCKRALQKLNFNYEGTMVDSEIKNGQFFSVDLFASLKTNRK
ncbi:GNAT family N-acetyltransferase [Aquimarina intermedia]|uniref:Ribosomal-protein-alanine N-acetyltransferase n=1 Tax=Aquimarina intermedia TaxID=350814 RepID=A0A5S5BT59_9FLAO|nr:GNAT family N-acetyltransferase [Aquimarina intermedia]TYP70361.1 ribosomal-protein-alanine N-acetyltransferase [Aquimarina intermedia]